MQVSKKFP